MTAFVLQGVLQNDPNFKISSYLFGKHGHFSKDHI